MTVIAIKKEERTNKALAAIITIVIHAALFLFLLYYIITTPIPPYPTPPGGPELELDFGNGINGTGNVEAPDIGNNQSEDNKATQAVPVPVKAETQVVTNEAENSVPLNDAKKATVTPDKKEPVKPQPQISAEQAEMENKFKNAKGSSGGNGNSGEAGNAGSPNGSSPGTSMGSGSGPGGNGKGWSLNGRQLLFRPTLVTNHTGQGQIVVGITVDADGNVTEATPGVIGTTISDASLYILVKNAAMKTKFNKSHDDTPELTGTITFVFTIQ